MSESADDREIDSGSDSDATVVVGAENEATVVVEHRHRGTAAVEPSEQEGDDSVDESTVVVSDRGVDPDATIVVAARASNELGVTSAGLHDAEQSDVVKSEAAEDADKTLVVNRPPERALTKAEPRRRGLLRPAPVSVDVLNRAVQAPGPGAIATYTSRSIQPPPLNGPIDTGATIVRQDSATIPSIGRRSSATALIVFVSVAGAILVSAGGLIMIALAIFG